MTYLDTLLTQRESMRERGVTVQFIGAISLYDQPVDTLGRITQGSLRLGEGTSVAAYGGDTFLRITSLYQSYEQFRIEMGLYKHGGLDVDNPSNLLHPALYAWAPGEVDEIIWDVADNPGGGLAVRINHGQEVYSKCSHMDGIEPSLQVGDWVARGESIGWMGNTGEYVTNKRADGTGGEHLHFSCRYKTKLVDPLVFLVPEMVYPEMTPEIAVPDLWTPGIKPTFQQFIHAAIDSEGSLYLQDAVATILDSEYEFYGSGRDVTEIMRIAVRKPWLVPYNDDRDTRAPPPGGAFSKADYEAWQAAQR